VNDQIQLRGLRLVGLVGLLPEELIRPQPLEIDVDIEADLLNACATDDLADTVDYGEVVARIESVVATEQYKLLERLAGRVAEELLTIDHVAAITVTMRKLRPPVPSDMVSSAVRIHRSR
jgi:dihydroneopterin aldolase